MIPNSVTSIRNAEDRVGNLDKSLLPSEEEKGCRTPPGASDYSLPLVITPTAHCPLDCNSLALKSQQQLLFQAYHKGPSVSSTLKVHALSPDLDREYKSHF